MTRKVEGDWKIILVGRDQALVLSLDNPGFYPEHIIIIDRSGEVRVYHQAGKAGKKGRVESRQEAETLIPARPAGGPEGRSDVKAVFDQMFRGFADIIAREVPGVELHEIVGRGLDSPVKSGVSTKWPANDDYDVLKTVERLALQGGKVVFFTGDKRLARQAEALGLDNVIVKYMPPNEYTGKESLARAMIKAIVEAMGSG
ncbi:MAG: hypothetical protein LRS48_01995 [Desulfurococcales archaeon]|nr:hypothetical protein [Desulfurococcales archaeon]